MSDEGLPASGLPASPGSSVPRWVFFTGGAVVVMLVAVLIVVVSGGESSTDRTPNEVLAAARDFVAGATSVEYTSEFETEITDELAGGGFVDRGSSENAAVFPNRGRSVVELGGFVSETIFVRDDVYLREATSEDDLEDEQFGQLDPDRPGSVYALPQETFLFDRPQDLGDVLDEARRPSIAREGDRGTLLRVRFDPDDLLPIGFEPYDEATGTLLIDSNDRLRRVELEASGPDSRIEATVDVGRWNGRIEIEAPDEDDLDPTPFVDEDAIADYTETPLFQPQAIPEEWVLDYADVIPEEASFEGCEQVNVGYVDPEELFGYMDVYIFPTSCAFGAPGGSDDFVAGPYRGWIDGEPTSEEGVTAELDVDGTTIQVYTDLPREALIAILSDLVPFDLDNPPTPTLPLN